MPAPCSVVLNYASRTVAFLTFQVMGLLACATMPDFQGLHVNKKYSAIKWLSKCICMNKNHGYIEVRNTYTKSLVFRFHILHVVCSSLMRACGEKGNGKRRLSILGGLTWPYPDFPFGWCGVLSTYWPIISTCFVPSASSPLCHEFIFVFL